MNEKSKNQKVLETFPALLHYILCQRQLWILKIFLRGFKFENLQNLPYLLSIGPNVKVSSLKITPKKLIKSAFSFRQCYFNMIIL